MEAEPVAPRWRRIAREALPLVVLLAVAAKSTAGEWRAYDLTPSDETQYLAMAWQMSDPGARPAEENELYVPLYVGCYRLLLLLPIEGEFLPFVAHGVLLTTLTGLFYALARRLGTGRWVGATAAAALVLHTRFALVSPFPVHLAAASVACGALAGTYCRSVAGACGPLGFAMLAACYVRNEFGTALLAFLPAYLALGAWNCRPGARREFLSWAVPLLAAVGACAATLGLPLPDGPRGLFAFGQHYARNVAETSGRGSEVWNLSWREELAAEFGDVRTVGDALRANPHAFAWHVGRNLSRAPGIVLEMCRPKLELSNTFRTPAYLLVLTALGVGLLGTFRRVYAGGLRGPDGQPLRAVLVAGAVVAGVSGLSVVLIYPREHYLVLPLFFVLVLAAAGLPTPRWPVKWFGEPTSAKVGAVACAAGALLVVAAPTACHDATILRPLVRKQVPAPSFELRETTALLRALPRRASTRVLFHKPAVPFVTVWMAQPVHLVPHQLKAEGFGAFVARYDVGIVVLDTQLREDERFATDPEFLSLWDETDTGAFTVLKSPGGYRVAVRRDLLAPE